MNIVPLLNIEATLTSVTDSTEKDEYGDLQEDTATSTVLCWHEPERVSEDTNQANIQTQRHIFYFLPDTVVTGFDRLEVDGLSFEFDGPPEPWVHPRSGVVVYQSAYLKRAA